MRDLRGRMRTAAPNTTPATSGNAGATKAAATVAATSPSREVLWVAPNAIASLLICPDFLRLKFAGKGPDSCSPDPQARRHRAYHCHVKGALRRVLLVRRTLRRALVLG